ncbi:MAG: hypothetical protein JWR83_1957 [Aeromicrobium sp.]|nr:hypothetical protein [Aeromicrobium sp.]
MAELTEAEPTIDGAALAAATERLVDLLKLRTLPIGMSRLPAERLAEVPGLRRPSANVRFSTCQLVTQSRIAGYTMGILQDSLLSNCASVVGMADPNPRFSSGEAMTGVWFTTKDAARAHQEQMPRAPRGEHGLCVSPLRTGRLDPPEICLFYANPAQMILFINGLQHRRYRRYDFSVTGESACADSWGHALATGETSLSLPCFAERRYGGVADDELLMACPPAEYLEGVAGVAWLAERGMRYPITPYGVGVDPAAGMAPSYS